MKHGWHTQHFLGGWKTLKTQPALLIIAPLASIIGFGALINTVLYAISFALPSGQLLSVLPFSVLQFLPPSVIGPTLVGILTHPLVLGITAVFLFTAILCQTALIHITHQHGVRRKRVSIKDAFQRAIDQWLRMFLVHITSVSVVLLLVLDMHYAFQWLTGPRAAWALVPIFLIDALLILYALTIKMIALQLIAGDNIPFLTSIQRAWNITWRSPLLLLEHNILLFVCTVLVMILLAFGVQLIGMLTTAIATWEIVLSNNSIIGSVLGVGGFVLGVLFITGLLTSYNFATWSHVVKHLEKSHVPGAWKRMVTRYFPL